MKWQTGLRKAWLPWVGIVVILVAGLALWLRFGKKPLQPLTPEALDQAMALWKAHEVQDYDVEIEVAGVQSGRHVLQVRGGKVTNMTTNGIADPLRAGEYWTVAGMFRTLDEELALAQKPVVAFGVTDPQSVYLAAYFDPALGYPRYYLRQIFGKNLTVDWEVKAFRAIAKP
jgi:hypothetical protein